jgi:hypothetical protein
VPRGPEGYAGDFDFVKDVLPESFFRGSYLGKLELDPLAFFPLKNRRKNRGQIR